MRATCVQAMLHVSFAESEQCRKREAAQGRSRQRTDGDRVIRCRQRGGIVKERDNVGRGAVCALLSSRDRNFGESGVMSSLESESWACVCGREEPAALPLH